MLRSGRGGWAVVTFPHCIGRDSLPTIARQTRAPRTSDGFWVSRGGSGWNNAVCQCSGLNHFTAGEPST